MADPAPQPPRLGRSRVQASHIESPAMPALLADTSVALPTLLVALVIILALAYLIALAVGRGLKRGRR